MKTWFFIQRNSREILRDRLNLAFGIGFPVVLLFLFTFIQSNVPVALFELEELTPGIIVFGFSFLALFSGMLIAKDRTSSFVLRLFTSPLKSSGFIAGYTVPMIPMAAAQAVLCLAVAVLLGLQPSLRFIPLVLVQLPAALLYIALGLLCGSVLNDKAVGGVCGAFLTNFSAWLSDTWFDIELVGGTFAAVAEALPFYHAVQAGRHVLAGRNPWPDLLWVSVYAAAILALAIILFRKKMKSV